MRAPLQNIVEVLVAFCLEAEISIRDWFETLGRGAIPGRIPGKGLQRISQDLDGEAAPVHAISDENGLVEHEGFRTCGRF